MNGRRVAQPTAQTWNVRAPVTSEPYYRWPWQGVNWSPAFFFFLVYLFSVTSYQIDAGSPAMALAIVSLLFGGTSDRIRLPTPFAILLGFVTIAALTYKVTQFSSYDWKPFTDLLKVVAIGVVAVSVLNNRRRLRFFLFYFLAIYALYPVRGALFNYFIYHSAEADRIAWNGIFANPNDYSTMMLLPIGVSLGLLFTEKEKLIRLCAFTGIGLMALTMFMTQSRGGLLALVAGAGLVFLSMKKHRTKFMIAIAVFSLVIVAFAPRSVWTRLAGLDSAIGSGNLKTANDRNSAAQRFELWKVAYTVGKDFPITGVGWGAYPNANYVYSRGSQFDELAAGARDAHNTYLTLFAETGALGLAIWLSAFIAVAVTGVRTLRLLRAYLPEYAEQLKFVLVSMFSLSVAAMFGSFAHWSSIYILLATITALGLQGRREIEERQRVYAGR